MEIKGKVYCFFEQSGTFKQEFIKLGIPAEDYDIQNHFGQTDNQCNLFYMIENAYNGNPSIFDNIHPDDLIIAFFPCTYFCQQNTTFFDGTQWNWKNKDTRFKSDNILLRSRERQKFYETALMLFTICDTNGLRLIVENPFDTKHFLHNNFPYKPTIIDKNRQLRGDYFKKPTQYWFINCEPTNGKSYQEPKEKKNINTLSGHTGDINRSQISSDYARNFICDFILGKEQQNTIRTLFQI